MIELRRLPNALASFLVFFASGAVLVLETLSLRLVGPYVGVSLQVTSSVIGVSLAAIAYGAWIGGWLADRRDPVRLVTPALILAAMATAVTLPIVRYSGELLRGAAVQGILLLTGLAVFIPILLLSTIPPLVVKLQLGDLRRTGQVVGNLSSIGTLGAVTATLATGFILVAALPSSVIMVSLAMALGAVGLAVGIYLNRRGVLIRRSRTAVSLAVLGLAGAGMSAVAPNPCDIETAYHCATVRADPLRESGRVLYLNSAEHSYVDLADPVRLQFAYMQWFGIVADFAAPPGQRVVALHLGGGGFTMPRYLAATRPGTANVVFEIDGGLVGLARRSLDLRTGPSLQVVVGDARMLIGERPDASADFVVGDAFGDLAVPWHLATREMAGEIRRVIRPNGVYVQNVIDYPPGRFIRAEVATVSALFDHVALIAPPAALNGRQGSNFVIVASPSPLPITEIFGALQVHGGEPVTLIEGAQLAAFTGSAMVLTDDYAPVDQLLVTH